MKRTKIAEHAKLSSRQAAAIGRRPLRELGELRALHDKCDLACGTNGTDDTTQAHVARVRSVPLKRPAGTTAIGG